MIKHFCIQPLMWSFLTLLGFTLLFCLQANKLGTYKQGDSWLSAIYASGRFLDLRGAKQLCVVVTIL